MSEPLAELPRAVQAVAELARDRAGRNASGGEAAERAAHIGQAAQGRAQRLAQAAIVMEKLDEIEPRLDPRAIDQRRADVRRERAGAGAGDGAVDRVEQAALALAGRRWRASSRLSRVAPSIAICCARLEQARRAEKAGSAPLAV